MEYRIKFTEQCIEEIENICGYLNEKLKMENASIRLRTQIMKKVKQLINNPEMYITIKKKDRTKRTYRKIVINNYIILYTIDYVEGIVYISHMYYGEQNYFQGLI